MDIPDETYETGLRDRVLLSFMYATGARAQEICDFKVGDLRIHDRMASITLTGKGSKTRQVGISVTLEEMVQNIILNISILRDIQKGMFFQAKPMSR